MGTQPNRKLAKRGSNIRSWKLRNNVKKEIDKDDYKKASGHITKAVRKSGGSSYLAGVLVAGIIAYKESKKTPTASGTRISGEAISKLPKNISKQITLAGRDSIRSALSETLSKRRK
ncbi:MAG: hypothetical protein K5790_01805 [Nitrosopumilus sp.]|uniref:hypothetical protein n=1 Tax=Nitrosopumilus sp. TaxID=2024843 RepID=UPI00247CD3BF|nr:hypothetical protein [Nitrosopumilus sp.]MCV0392009.1 hypothetical protein [Nitrosopumilus sp.]